MPKRHGTGKTKQVFRPSRPTAKPIRILLAGEHTLVRAGIRRLLESLQRVLVVAEASDGRDVLRLIKKHQPKVVLMDTAMSWLNALELCERVAKEFPNTRMILLSIYADEEHVRQALRWGVTGYVLKSSAIAELELAIKSVARGETYLCPPVSKRLAQDYTQPVSSKGDLVKRLTARQRQVLQLIAAGYSTKGIAQILSLSVKTVETHRAQLMERLDIHEIAGLVCYAIRTGLVKLEQ